MEDCTYVIFGATGNLSRVKLIPALYHLEVAGRLPDGLKIVGFGRRDRDDDAWRGKIREWRGDRSLFLRYNEVSWLWKVVDPVLKVWSVERD